ncbi:MAG: ATP-dependent helicase RecG [Actinomycetota bacterium]|jgi:ATP-dependent DNA helicase RecG
MTAEPVPALERPVRELEGVGPRLAKGLAELGIVTVRELLEHAPRRYQDAGEVLDLAEVEVGAPATLIGEVFDVASRRIPARGGGRTRDLTTLRVRQASGALFGVTFFNQAWRARQLVAGTVAAFSGKVERFRGELQLAAPDVQVLGAIAAGLDPARAAAELEHQRLLAVYPASAAVPSFKLVGLVEAALADLPTLEDFLPDDLGRAHGLVDLDTAVRDLHRPDDHAAAARARARLVFDELLVLQLGLQWRRARLEADTVGLDNAPVDDGHAARFLAALPFPPTGAQQRAFASIATDLGRERPMHRLLQGDVGAGKTVVAVWAMLAAVDRGRQAALMVPTEVLAEQHHRTLLGLLEPLGVNLLDGLRIEVLTSSTGAARRRRILEALERRDLDVLVGTHALLEEGVRFADLGVVVIDEQHRFGVSQRVRLKDKASEGSDGREVLPDVLVMTATPIPRSLALTLYGDLDVTVLDELPPGRTPVTTTLVTPDMEGRRERVWEFVRREAAEGRRAYVVCPLVEPSEAGGTSAVEHHAHLSTEVLPELTVELVHGRMGADAKDAAMARFRSGEAQVLVATTVIEVGVDVPEASVMVIEDAERFGISQLHQLRGRVGRGAAASHCVLFTSVALEELPEEGRARLEAIAATTDGFVLAETDLEVRGEGQLFGRRQSGLPDLRLARLQRDLEVVGRTRELAAEVIAADPELAAPERAALRAEVLRRYGGDLDAFAALETG